MKSIIDVKNLSFRYKESQEYYDVKDITFHVKRGEWLSIVGHNGSGKSTTVRLIDGLLEAESGEIVIDGQRLTEENIWNIRRQIGMVFQNPDNQFVGATVEDDVAFGLENQGLSRQEMQKRVEEALDLVGMLDFKKREPARLSGGQKQRVAIAGVVALRPAILILDEATSMLDPEGVKAEFTGRNDLEIDGKKFCGNAQAYINGRIMHHGCLLFDVDLSVLANALKVSKDKFESKGVKSVRARVTNIVNELPEKITVEEFRDLLLEYMKKEYPEMTEYVFSEQELAEINRIKDTKFGTWDWNYGKSPEFNVRRGTKFTSGKVEVFANIVESKIQDIKIYGDFFGIEDVAAVEDVLRGVKYEREDVLKALETIDITRYFAGISREEIAEAVVG